MRALNLLAIFLILFTACDKKPGGYTISGTTNDIVDSTELFLSINNEIVDSALVMDNKFQFSGQIETEYAQALIHTGDRRDYNVFWMENQSIVFNGSVGKLKEAKVTGSRIESQYTEYETLIEVYRAQLDSIGRIARTGSDSLRAILRPSYDSILTKENETGLAYIKQHLDYELSAYFLFYFLKNGIPKDSTKAIYERFDEKVKATKWGEKIARDIDNSTIVKSRKFEVGDSAANFALKTLAGEDISLNDYKGKYVLLEFWAAWCGPCRKENPNLVKAYAAYKDQGFEILGVNLDEKYDEWEKAVAEDSVIWTTVSDSKGFEGEVPVTYSVSYIPTNLLLDKNGVVLAKDLHGEKLEEELAKIFGS